MRCLKCRPANNQQIHIISRTLASPSPRGRGRHHTPCLVRDRRCASCSLIVPLCPSYPRFVTPPAVGCLWRLGNLRTLVSCDMPCIFHDERTLHPFSFLLRVQALKMLPVRGQGRPRERVSHGLSLSHFSIALVRCGSVFILSVHCTCSSESLAHACALSPTRLNAFACHPLRLATALSSIFKALVLDGSNTVSSKHFLGFLSRSGIQKYDPRIKSIIAYVFTFAFNS